MAYEYYRLRDIKNKGTIVRTEGMTHHQYIPGEGWVESGILVRYFNDESDYYDLCDEISEEEALDAINKTREREIR